MRDNTKIFGNKISYFNSPLHVTAQAADHATKGSDETKDLPQWDLTDLYRANDAPELLHDVKLIETLSKKFAADWKGKLHQAAKSEGQDGIGAAIQQYEMIEETIGRLMAYAGLNYFSDTSDVDNAKFYGDMQSKITDASAHMIFFTLELNQLEEADIDGAIENDPLTAHYKPWLIDLRKDRPFQLEDRVEQLFHEKSVTGRSAWNRLFDETMSDMRFDIDGEELTLEPTLNLLQSPQPEQRKKAAKALTATFSANLRIFTLITNTLAKDLEISNRWRGFEDIADSRHLANRVERNVVDALTSAVHDAYPRISHRYYKMKAKWLNMDKLNTWDRNAPLSQIKQDDISWDKAKHIVLDAYHQFSPQMADIARDFFDKNWIDAAMREGKASGAFAHPTVPSAHPYILINYMGKPRDVMTLAHELGHGVHQVLAARQGALMADTPLTLAETASVFGEMLTFRQLLAKTQDNATKKMIIAQKVEDMINTVTRQIAFYEFERKLHTARQQGELTSDMIGELWMSVQGESLGPAIQLNDGYETFWTYIPHFIHSPFYVYAYAFGDCLVNSLYAVYEQSDDGFEEKYFDMLKAGGTKHHSELLAPFGLDATDPDFWKQGLSMIETLIDDLEALESH